MSVYEKLMNVQSKLKAPKNQYNSFGKYNYRSCEDILEGLKGLLTENKATLTLSDEIVQIGNRFYIKAIATFTDIEDGKSIQASALAREDETKKGMDLAQVTGSVSSYARKYALNGLFCIDDTKDPDATNNHGKGKQLTNVPIDLNSPNNANKANKNLSEPQVKRLFAIALKAGFKADKVKTDIMAKYHITEIASLTKEQYDHVCSGYENYKK